MVDTKFKIGDRIRGIRADIIGCDGIIIKIREEGYDIKLTKMGIEEWHAKEGWVVGKTLIRNTFWDGCIELIEREWEE